MATLEDRILGEKKQYYYDSDTESDDDSKTETDVPTEQSPPSSIASSGSSNIPIVESREWEGTAVNTGPKGVIRDWQRYKQLEAERRQCQEAEKRALVQKLAFTCRSHLDDEKEKQVEGEHDSVDVDIANLMLEDDFLREYVQRRMEDMMNSVKNLPRFGSVIELSTGDQFLRAVDEENKDVTVIVHLYDDGTQGCEAMNGCLQCLAQDYPHVKFCKMKASVAHLTKRFTVKGVPALLVYKAGSLIGNFVQLTKELGEDFFAVDVEAFLIENGIIHDKAMVPNMARNQQAQLSDDSSSGSDFELD